ncbi:MAG: AAA family ATPase, partial [Hadesarchaea archaeon]|nr:AAA family ATPase [Hadesarchaea archaeon]
MAENELKLVVAENRYQNYVNRGFALIDEGIMKKIGLKQGDYIEITGTRSTGAIAIKGAPEDRGLEIIRIDGMIRHNAGTSIGEKVTVRKASIKEAKSVSVAPTEPNVRFMGPGEVIKRNLIGRPVAKGDLIAPTPPETEVMDDFFGSIFGSMALPFGLGEVKFVVTRTNPSGIVLVTDMTNVEVLPEAVELKELKVPPVTYEDIGGLKLELERVREMIELPLKHPELFDRLGIDPPKGVLLHGPPGTGKTLIAKAVANESGANFISINGPEIMCVAGNTQMVIDGQVKTAEQIFSSYRISMIGKGSNHISFKATGKVMGVTNPSFTAQKTPLIEVTQVNVPNYYKIEFGTANYEVSSNHPILVLTESGLSWKTPPMLKPGDYPVGAVIRELRAPEIGFYSRSSNIKI